MYINGESWVMLNRAFGSTGKGHRSTNEGFTWFLRYAANHNMKIGYASKTVWDIYSVTPKDATAALYADEKNSLMYFLVKDTEENKELVEEAKACNITYFELA